MIRILVGSPVRQKPQILREFLSGLEEAEGEGFRLSFLFVDDNTDESSSALLRDFSARHDCLVLSGKELLQAIVEDRYSSNEVTHTWDDTAIEKIAAYKDRIIESCISQGFDYLLFIDSDIVVDRRMIPQLLSRDVEIISNVFWTQWKPDWELEPQCFWIPSPAMQTNTPFSAAMSAEESRQLRKDFFAKMRVPGLYQVDGLGACTLIKRSALEKGVRFRRVPNLSLHGEDRHFCIRAGVLGIPLYYDTVYPAYHIYRDAYLDRVDEFKREGFTFDMCQTWNKAVPAPRSSRFSRLLRRLKSGFLTVCKQLYREFFPKKQPVLRFRRSLDSQRVVALIYVNDVRKKYLSRTLGAALALAEHCLIYDDTEAGLSDAALPAELDGARCRLLRDSARSVPDCRRGFRRLWEQAAASEPDWVLALFAGELPEDALAPALPYLLRNQFVDLYYFRRYDMWDAAHYREDAVWSQHQQPLPYLMRYCSDYPFRWKDADLSVKFPAELARLKHAKLDWKFRSYRWAETADRAAQPHVGPEDDVLDPALAEKRTQTLAEAPALKLFDAIPAPFRS